MREQRFGRYRLLERIDIGGMAEVFRGVQQGVAGFERVVAIKRILPNIAADPETVRMFIDEAKLAVHLSHPNIAQILDLGEQDGSYFIAMEYIDGHSLSTLYRRFNEMGAPCSPEAVCYIMAQVAEALHYAHFAQDDRGMPLGIIHRDVSPQNILVSFSGHVKVIDFGLAKASNRASETQVGVVKGKIAYLSPEQAHGRRIDRRSDLFSFGICSWELLTGRRGFKRSDDRATILAIRDGHIEPASRYAKVPSSLDAVVKKALAVDRDQRYRTGLEIREDLEHVMRAESMSFDRRALAILMRRTFPERFEEESPVSGAISLVKAKSTPGAPSAAPPGRPTEGPPPLPGDGAVPAPTGSGRPTGRRAPPGQPVADRRPAGPPSPQPAPRPPVPSRPPRRAPTSAGAAHPASETPRRAPPVPRPLEEFDHGLADARVDTLVDREGRFVLADMALDDEHDDGELTTDRPDPRLAEFAPGGASLGGGAPQDGADGGPGSADLQTMDEDQFTESAGTDPGDQAAWTDEKASGAGLARTGEPDTDIIKLPPE